MWIHLRATWHHLPYGITVLSATQHKWICLAITPANQASTQFTYPGGMEGRVDLCSLIAARPGITPTTAWSQVRCPNCYSTKLPTVRAIWDCWTFALTVLCQDTDEVEYIWWHTAASDSVWFNMSTQNKHVAIDSTLAGHVAIDYEDT